MVAINGVIEYWDLGHRHVDVVVTSGNTGRQTTHEVGVDEKPNRGKIITFLGTFYGVPPGDILWPAHIELETGA